MRMMIDDIPPLTMLKPKKSMIRQRSQPKPVLSGQFTVITVGSPSFSASLIITTSSYSIPISSSSSSSSVATKSERNEWIYSKWVCISLLPACYFWSTQRKGKQKGWSESLRVWKGELIVQIFLTLLLCDVKRKGECV